MRTAVLICSCHAQRGRRAAQRETWIKQLTPDMPYFFYVGQGSTELEADVVRLDVADGYNDLPPKLHKALSHAVNTLSFDWLIRLDDDSFLAPERLPGLIAEMAGRGADYFGSDSCRAEGSGYATGGAGMVLSRKAAEILTQSPCPPPCPRSPDQDDGWAGFTLWRNGVKFYWTPRLHHDQVFRPQPSNDIVTGHYVLPPEMQALYRRLYDAALQRHGDPE